jgi:hypothetical protein
MKTITILGGLALILGLAVPAWALDEAGRVTEVQGTVQALHSDGQADILKLNAKVYVGDRIQTGPSGRVTMLFLDDSVLTLASKTKIEINSLVYKPKENLRCSVFSLVEGKLKAAVGGWFSETGQENQWQLRTPTAVAGVRGTSLVAEVGGNGASSFAGLSGVVAVSALVDAQGHIVALQANNFVVVPPGGLPGQATVLDAAALQALLDEFQFTNDSQDQRDDGVWEAKGLHLTQLYLTPEALGTMMGDILGQGDDFDNPADVIFQEPAAMTTMEIHVVLP